jgi:hypothetical protein
MEKYRGASSPKKERKHMTGQPGVLSAITIKGWHEKERNKP